MTQLSMILSKINGVIRNAKGLLKKDRERKKTIDDVHILLIL